MKMYGGMEVPLHTFLTSAPDGDVWLASRPGEERQVPTEWEFGWAPGPV